METSVGAIIENEGKFLLTFGRRKTWGFPKGHVEAGETLKQTAKREVREETGLKIELLDIKEEIEILTQNGKKKLIYFLAKLNPSSLKPNEEVLKAEWLTKDEAIERITFDDLRELFIKITN